EVAETVIKLCVSGTDGSAKVLVTDLDNVLWAGLAAEDGPDGIKCSSEGIGFRHFVYQSFLARLKANGVLLAAVSRNDLEVARAPITTGKTLLSENDFIEILASYDAKSAHIRRLTESLNLGMDAFVFVDDNPIELAEVGSALPAITCRQFPSQDDKLAQFLNDLNALFARSTISEEDRQRTEMYRRRQTVAAQTSLGKEGTDLTDFLANLQMELVIQDRSSGDRERAVQLINKTNQFNLNGRRVTDDEVSRILSAGGKLYTAKLTDRTGSHGEILVCLVDEHNKILSFVLSCRVFQRRVEHAFTCWIVRRLGNNLAFTYRATERNTPIRDFLKDPAFKIQGEEGRLDGDSFQRDHGKTLELFRLQEVGFERT
ncbi:MAG: HAD-IIIC family phosphatase, partial [Nitrospirota bacterium]|nr:HAD-IIIC family phosphatase [Nitrospirota bacterium]